MPCNPAATALNLVEIIELKWLLAGEGVHVHVERLQTDLDYARHTLQRASQCQQPNLRAAAVRMRQRLGLVPTNPVPTGLEKGDTAA